MYIDPNSKICGKPALVVRSLMRKIGDGNVSVEFIAENLNAGMVNAKRLTEKLIHEGYLEINHQFSSKEKIYCTTLQGNSLSLASAAKPIKRDTADKKLLEFMGRVNIVNSDNYYLYKVKKVVVFGSYLSKKERLNDVDVAVEIVPKYDNDEQFRRNEERVNEVGKKGTYFSTFLDRLFFPELEVIKYLKSRSRTISLHRTEDPILEQVETKTIYDDSAEHQNCPGLNIQQNEDRLCRTHASTATAKSRRA